MSTIRRIPFLDLISPHIELQGALIDVFKRALLSGAFVGGNCVEAFEHAFASFCCTRYCVGVSSGTDALRLALIASGVEPGDVVITVPNTFVATIEAIVQVGAIPEFVDVDERTYNMDPQGLRSYVEHACTMDKGAGQLVSRRSGRPVTCIIPVHLYGQIADMDPINAIAEQYRLTVIEDACQGHGAEYYSNQSHTWRRAGSIGRAAAFSFYPGKNLGACGEAGAITTDDEHIARCAVMLRDHGQSVKYHHDLQGYNARLDAIQAGILNVKLQKLAEWNAQRRRWANLYDQLLSTLSGSVIIPYEPSNSHGVYHLYVIRLADRDGLREHLSAKGIDSSIHYPVPVHLQCAYRNLGYHKGDLPVSERIAGEILSLPMYPQLTQQQLEEVTSAISRFCDARQRSTAAVV